VCLTPHLPQTRNVNGTLIESTRKKIGESLRRKWREDEAFRDRMTAVFKERRGSNEKISKAITAKWKTDEYRSKQMQTNSMKEKRGVGKGSGSGKAVRSASSIPVQAKTVQAKIVQAKIVQAKTVQAESSLQAEMQAELWAEMKVSRGRGEQGWG